MLHQVLSIVVVALMCQLALAEYGSDSSRASHHYATSSPSTYSQEYRPTPAAEAKSYKEDDTPAHRPYGDPRTGPPKKVGSGPGPVLPYASPSLPLNYPHSHRLLPPGSVIGYLAYPQPIQHEPYPGLLPSAAYSHVAYAAPLAISPYPKPYSHGPGPAIPSYSSYSSAPHSTYHQ